jgi:hypothetical protein
MLVGIPNFALVQFLQALAVCGFLLLAFTVVSIRLRLKRSKLDALFDIVMCVIILLYAIILKINLST